MLNTQLEATVPSQIEQKDVQFLFLVNKYKNVEELKPRRKVSASSREG